MGNVSIDDVYPDYSGNRSTAEIVILSTVVAILILLSFFGNLMVVICIRWNRRLRQETGNMFLANLSIADMSTALIVMTATLQSIAADGWVLPMVLCSIVCAMNYVLIIVSMITLCFIAVDRYAAVLYPLTYDTIVTKKRVLVIISYAWFHGLLFGLAPSVMQWTDYDYWEMVCSITWDKESDGIVVYVVSAFVCCFALPGCVLATCYWKVMKVARRLTTAGMSSLGTWIPNSPAPNIIIGHISDADVIGSDKEISRRERKVEADGIGTSGEKRRVAIAEHISVIDMKSPSTPENSGVDPYVPQYVPQPSSNVNPSQSDPGQTWSTNAHRKSFAWFGSVIKSKTSRARAESYKRANYSSSRKAIRSLLIVVVAFFVCLTPFCITKLYKVILHDDKAPSGQVNSAATIFQYCSSAINPLIYGIFRKDFREVFKQRLQRMFCRSSAGGHSGDSGMIFVI